MTERPDRINSALAEVTMNSKNLKLFSIRGLAALWTIFPSAIVFISLFILLVVPAVFFCQSAVCLFAVRPECNGALTFCFIWRAVVRHTRHVDNPHSYSPPTTSNRSAKLSHSRQALHTIAFHNLAHGGKSDGRGRTRQQGLAKFSCGVGD